MTNETRRIGHFGALTALFGGYIFGLALIVFRRWILLDGTANYALQTLMIALVPTGFALVTSWIVECWRNLERSHVMGCDRSCRVELVVSFQQ